MIEDPRESRTCASVEIGPVSLMLSGLLILISSLSAAILFSLDKKLPPITWMTAMARLAIIAVCTAGGVGTIIAIANVQSAGYVFVAFYRIQICVTVVFSILSIYCHGLLDVHI